MLGIVLLLVGALVVVPVLALPVLFVAVAVFGEGSQDYLQAVLDAGTLVELTPAGLLYLNVTLGGLILLTWLLIRMLHQLRPRWLSSVAPKLRWRFLFVCVGLSVVALIAQLVVGVLLPGQVEQDASLSVNEVTGTTIALGLVVLFTTPFQAAGEEYVFRGYLFQAVGALSRNRWLALVVTSLLFALAHGFQNPPLFFDRFMFGLVAGWLVIRTGGLEAAIAMHVLNNYLAFGLALAFGDISSTLNVTEVSWWNVPLTLTQSLVYAAVVAWAAGRMGLQTRTTVPGRDPATPGPLAPGEPAGARFGGPPA